MSLTVTLRNELQVLPNISSQQPVLLPTMTTQMAGRMETICNGIFYRLERISCSSHVITRESFRLAYIPPDRICSAVRVTGEAGRPLPSGITYLVRQDAQVPFTPNGYTDKSLYMLTHKTYRLSRPSQIQSHILFEKTHWYPTLLSTREPMASGCLIYHSRPAWRRG